MKKLIALVLCLVMALSMVACGGGEDAGSKAPKETTAAPATTAAPETTAAPTEATEPEAGLMVSDEDFASMQEGYAALVELYNTVIDIYSDDQVEADEELNQLLNDTKALIEEMGEITQDSLTEADAMELMDLMVDLADALGMMADGMTEGMTESNLVSDEDFAALQEAYASLVELYDTVIEIYSDDEIAADEDINEALSQTKEIIDEMGEITRDGLTEEDAMDLLDAMDTLAEALTQIVDSMEAA